MKKTFLAAFAVMVFAVMSCFTTDSENAGETDIHGHSIHNHAAAAGYGDIHWQCNKCGLQEQYRGPSSNPSLFGCDVSRDGKHSWGKIYAGGSRSVHWQCVNCGETTWISSFPNEFGCSRGSGSFKRHIWQRLD